MNMIYEIETVDTGVNISKTLCGNFIELGYGRQVEGMQSEMIFNRRFADFPAYTAINKDWYDLIQEPDEQGRRYQTDWSVFDWYHNAYEHNAWYAAPGLPPSKRIFDENRYIVETTPYRLVRISFEDEAGRRFLRICNRDTQSSALAQDGKYVREGEEYRFSGLIRTDTPQDIELVLSKEGDFHTQIGRTTIRVAGDGFIEYACSLRADFSGFATLSLWIAGGMQLDLAEVSLKPAQDSFGFRAEIAPFIKERLKPSVIRWPGGCFASFYDFRDGIGGHRKTVPSYFWGGLNENDIGSMELGAFCEACGAEQMICVNVFHPRKAKYDHYFDEVNCSAHGYDFAQFTDLSEGAALARQWVEYMNGSVQTAMGALRASHGRPEPFHVKYWELDNEVYRWFTAEEYAKACVYYSREMKKADPSILTGMLTYGNFEINDETLKKMLEIAGKDIDFLADRGASEQNLSRKLGIMRAYNEANGTHLKYCNTEWLPYDMFYFHVDEYNRIEGDKSYMFTKWRYALNVFRQMMMWQREGEDVLFINFNNLANTHGQNAIDTPRDGIYLSACGIALGLMAQSPAAHLLQIKDYHASLTDPLQIQAAYDETKKQVVVYACNVLSEATEATVRLPNDGNRYRHCRIHVASAPALTSMNRQHRDEISVTKLETEVTSEEFHFQIPALSFTELVFSE